MEHRTRRPEYGTAGRPMLPIDEALPALKAALAATNAAVLVAPPGAGKTTVVAAGAAGRALGRPAAS